jgi:hypothetical protein
MPALDVSTWRPPASESAAITSSVSVRPSTKSTMTPVASSARASASSLPAAFMLLAMLSVPSSSMTAKKPSSSRLMMVRAT